MKLDPPIRILFLISGLGLGGSERQLFLTLKHLDQKRFQPSVIVFNQDPNFTFDEDLKRLGVQVLTIPETIKGIAARSWFLWSKFRSLRPHIIHSWTVHDNAYSGVIGWLAGVKVRLGSLRSSLYSDGIRLVPPLLRWISLHSVSGISVNSQNTFNELLDIHYSKNKIFFLPNIVEPPGANPVSFSEFGFEQPVKIVGTIGNLRRVKNHMMLLRGIAPILKARKDVALMIVGQPVMHDPGTHSEIKDFIKQTGLEKQVIVTGCRQDASSLMLGFDIFCLTSDNEGMPNALLEAMACGKPVIATRVGGIKEAVQDGVNGMLVDANDSEGLQKALSRVLDEPKSAALLGDRAREIMKKHNAGHCIQLLHSFYMKVC